MSVSLLVSKSAGDAVVSAVLLLRPNYRAGVDFYVFDDGGDSFRVLFIDQSTAPSLGDLQETTEAQSVAQQLAGVVTRIKVERDRLRFEGGVYVSGRWFRSDQIAAGEYAALALLGASLPPNTVLRPAWRTMDGTPIDMTPALVAQILAAGFSQVAAIDDAAQAHIRAAQSAHSPGAYDFSGGWPSVFSAR